jgi:DNA recombination protein RmuC
MTSSIWLAGALLVVFFTTCLVLLALILRRVHGREPSVGASGRLDALERILDRTERGVREELARARQETSSGTDKLRDQVTGTLVQLGDSLARRQSDLSTVQQGQWETFRRQLAELTQNSERKLEELRQTVDLQLTTLRTDNAGRLEQMRQTVDEKLQATLEDRLGASFRQVSERLEQVHRGLGEMQALATGVGDLKRVLANVRSRGVWGEVQLAALLEQVLAPEQYGFNVATRDGSGERVEFAVRLPGSEGGDGETVWLPIDAKFPLEDYQRLTDSIERGDAAGAEQAARDLEVRIRGCARDIRDKYLDPPRTTDFAILFLPTEGLYAEVLRRPGLADGIQRDFRVVLTGPTTLWAVLNSLKMGFRTLAIQKRSSEVWSLLAAVRTDFGRFGAALDAVQKKLQEASGKIDEAQKGSRRIERRLRDVQEPTAPDRLDAPPESPLFDLVPGQDEEL